MKRGGRIVLKAGTELSQEDNQWGMLKNMPRIQIRSATGHPVEGPDAIAFDLLTSQSKVAEHELHTSDPGRTIPNIRTAHTRIYRQRHCQSCLLYTSPSP